MKFVTKPQNRVMEFDPERLTQYVARIMALYPDLDQKRLLRGVQSKLKAETVKSEEITRAIYMTALELISVEEPDWTFVASAAYLTKLYKEAAINRGYKSYHNQRYGSFYKLLKALRDKGIYKEELCDKYTYGEIQELEKEMVVERDNLLTYIGLLTLDERYLTGDYDKKTLELPQERWMVIAMQLMIHEPAETRIELVKEAYWALSNLYMTVATPTLSNSGKAKGGQLSSCFIDTVPDDLRGIYDSNTDIATLSKGGGGIGTYVGKVRARGSDIRGYKGKSSGIVPWIRQINNTSTSVDQLGTRPGAVAVYLDVWHKDIMSFLDLKLNTGDERMRAHDIFQGVCLPDLFMEAARDDADWHLFCPHEVKNVMGWSLEDSYDEQKGKGTFRDRYQQCVEHPTLSRITVPALDIMARIMISQLETGTPFMFYRDTVNRANPNKAHGMIYSSNLCTEIAQNMSATQIITEYLEIDEDGSQIIVTRKKPGDFVVCNLSSVNLGRAVPDDVLERLIAIQVRMLDNVIDINRIEVLQAQLTNQLYRAVGLGTFGFHHLLALKKLRWESEEAVAFNDALYETVAFLAIRASMELAKEKGAYMRFAGSEWATGQYFVDRGYVALDEAGVIVPIPGKEDWYDLCLDVMQHGIRNGYLMAIAPNGSTSIIAGSTASVDPVYSLMAYEEKETYKIANPVPNLSTATRWYYKSAFDIDQHWSIRHAATRQVHIDQAQSFNLYVHPEIDAFEMLDLHLDAWDSGLKSTYYVRNKANEMPEECESCSA